ncbi:sugar ABC transporter substrate-binding protein [Actinoplanes derwentensis]|uniref:D-xylose transport system substrate-binding protein n=1 Tax=Actinoplanes derwentensis TaxID=113562 RepID=A0A1H1XCR9_9ACTN|nr:substrate-binding domain-containing protein [Actinoplanes derwentensis]GID87132.1 sugar ABC transporter substrate-binding protein [Actinoplanes derwentensis]SDT06851.1 D-xylose transport system substrate-binding protein [Actinoplanes derwentensis]
MRKSSFALIAVGLLASVTLSACDSEASEGATGSDAATEGTSSGKVTGTDGVAVILPDTTSSTRWVDDDPKYLQAAFDAAGVPAQIFNAEGDEEEFKRIAKTALDKGFKVLVIVNLSAASGKAVIQDAHSRNVPVIDYDRLTLNGAADYYVSFDNEKVGELQATGLLNCLRRKGVTTPVIAELNGSQSDNNAYLFKEGYDAVLDSRFDDATALKGPDQFVPGWDEDNAREIFALMHKQYPNIDGVLAANDGLGNAAIDVLKEKGRNGKVPVTGQDATVKGLQNILAGDQCMTVYKDTKAEADAAADLAIGLYKKEKPVVADKLKDPESGLYIPFKKLEPKAISLSNIKSIVEAGYVDTKTLCTADYLSYCRTAGLV